MNDKKYSRILGFVYIGLSFLTSPLLLAPLFGGSRTGAIDIVYVMQLIPISLLVCGITLLSIKKIDPASISSNERIYVYTPFIFITALFMFYLLKDYCITFHAINMPICNALF